MNGTAGQGGSNQPVHYELLLTPDEAKEGIIKLLPRNNKNLQVKIPAGVSEGSLVKLTNALQATDNRPGDIIISIKIKAEEPSPVETMPEGVVDITDSNFSDEVLGSNLPVVVDFWAPWCGPCRLMAPVMEKAAAHYHGKFKFCKINVDENPQSAGRYQAMSIPLLIFFKNGQVVERSLGAIPENELWSKLESLR